MSDEELIEESGGRGPSPVKLVFVAVVAVGMAAFIVQNTDDAPVSWLMFDGSAPVWMVIVISAVAGAVLSEALGWAIRRSRRRR